MRLGNGCRAALPGPALTTAASQRLTDGRRSTRSSVSSTCAASPRTTSITTKPGGDRSRCCTSSLTGIGSSGKAKRFQSGCTRTLIRSNSFSMERARARKKFEPLTHLEWKVKYEPGSLEARGTKDGKVVLTAKQETTGEPESIRLTPDRSGNQCRWRRCLRSARRGARQGGAAGSHRGCSDSL